MDKLIKNATEQLNNLIQVCLDGEEGYSQACEDVSCNQLHAIFREYAQQRAEFVADLQNQVIKYGADPKVEGSLIGSMHRGWMHAKSAIPSSDDTDIINECIRGDEAALADYEAALDTQLPKVVKDLVYRQYILIRATCDRIRAEELTRAHAMRS
jgi:uncharacterized protein (TIGR02284 family)